MGCRYGHGRGYGRGGGQCLGWVALLAEIFLPILTGVRVYRDCGRVLTINCIKERGSSTKAPINKGDSLPWLQKTEIKRKAEFRQAIMISILLFGILLVLLIGFYLKSLI